MSTVTAAEVPADLRAHRTQWTSDNGSFTDEERERVSDEFGVFPVFWPIPCSCPNGHLWVTPGTFGTGHGTYFDDADGQWCPLCREPEINSTKRGRAPDDWVPPVYVVGPWPGEEADEGLWSERLGDDRALYVQEAHER